MIKRNSRSTFAHNLIHDLHKVNAKEAAYLGGEAEAELAVDRLPEALDGVSLLI